MKTILLCLNLFLLSLAAQVTPSPTPKAPEKPKGVHNDQIYPAAPAAQKSITFDHSGFIVNGEPRYLASGSIHYPRVPHELWRDRLLRLKRAGFVNVETYFFWNYQEPRENEWNFTGDGDIEKFLETAQDLGLTAIVRVGPYVCAEWESGGWPLWLRFKPAMFPRTNDPEFLKWNDHWYDKVLPLVAKHQIHKGGNIILLQLENEHPLGWGVVNGDPYFDHLHAQAEKHQIEIPWFFSGLNHGGNPAPGDLDPSTRTNPWMSTETWPGWFDVYGLISDKKLHAIERANWTVLAHGGGGHNYYMLHGGTNFDAWSDDSTGTSYDYGSGIGEAGDLRPVYYKMKRANLLAESFPDILAGSVSVLHEFKTVATGVDVLGARRGPGGTLFFLQNNKTTEVTATFSEGGSVKLPRYSTAAFPRDVLLEKNLGIVTSTLPVLAVARNAGVTTVVFYGQPGETGRIEFTLPEKKSLQVTVPEHNVAESIFDLPERQLRVLVMPQDLTLRLWCLGEKEKQLLIVGPEFVQDVIEKDGTPVVTYERYLNKPSCGQIAVYGAKGKSWHFAASASDELEKHKAPVLGEWKMRSAAAPLAPDYDDSTWLESVQPLQMGADGDIGAHAWYRARFTAAQAGRAEVNVRGKDFLSCFVNGQPVLDHKAEVRAGANTLVVFASQFGRNKGFGYTKPLAQLDPKGLQEDVTLTMPGQKLTVTNWRMSGLTRLDGALWSHPAAATDWRPADSTAGLPTYYYTTFHHAPPSVPGVHPVLRLKWTGLGRGKVWINGHAVGRYPERIRVDSLYLPEPWLKDGENDLLILDDTGASPAGVSLVVDAASREIVQTSAPVEAVTPFVVPPENPPRDLAAMNQGNLAFQAAATASSEYNRETAARLAFDGDPDTAWRAAGKMEPGSPRPWLAVDLGRTLPLGVVEILWDGKSRDYKYTLEASVDGESWSRIGDQTTAVPSSPDSPSELSRLNFNGQTCQHLRVTINEGRNPGISELRVYRHGQP